MTELVALLDGRVVGTVRQDRQGKLQFVYDDGWRVRHPAWTTGEIPAHVRVDHDQQLPIS